MLQWFDFKTTILTLNCSFFCALQFQMLETSSVDDDLANLKNELSGGSKVSDTPMILFVPFDLIIS